MAHEYLFPLIARGDAAAFAELYGQHAREVFAFVRRILRDVTDAEEVVQDVFLQVWLQAGQFDPARGSAQAWIFTIARTRAIDRLRARAGVGVIEAHGSEPELLNAGDDDAERLLIRRETGERVRQAIERLPLYQRHPLKLATFDELTHAEISVLTREPLGTVKTRLRTSMIKLRASLGAPPPAFTAAVSAFLSRRPDTPYEDLCDVSVLVVDDDIDALRLLTAVLQSAGATVRVGRSVGEGLDRLRERWTSVMLVDLSMPGRDGFAMLREACAMASAAGRPVRAAAFTASVGAHHRRRALDAGFAMHLAKPAEPRRIVEAVKTLSAA